LMNISVFFMALHKHAVYPTIRISKLSAVCGVPNRHCPSRYPDGVTGSTRIDLECDDAQTEESPRTATEHRPSSRDNFSTGGLYTRTVTPSRRSWRSGPGYLILPEIPGCLTRKFARPGPCSSRPPACFRVRPFITVSISSSRPSRLRVSLSVRGGKRVSREERVAAKDVAFPSYPSSRLPRASA
jgi:hypothetical protein